MAVKKITNKKSVHLLRTNKFCFSNKRKAFKRNYAPSKYHIYTHQSSKTFPMYRYNNMNENENLSNNLKIVSFLLHIISRYIYIRVWCDNKVGIYMFKNLNKISLFKNFMYSSQRTRNPSSMRMRVHKCTTCVFCLFFTFHSTPSKITPLAHILFNLVGVRIYASFPFLAFIKAIAQSLAVCTEKKNVTKHPQHQNVFTFIHLMTKRT